MTCPGRGYAFKILLTIIFTKCFFLKGITCNNTNHDVSFFTLPPIHSIHSIQEVTNGICNANALSNTDCLAVMYFYIMHYAPSTTDYANKSTGIHKFVYTSRHHSNDIVFPVRLWLKSIPITAHQDASIMPPNSCLSHQLLHPTSDIFDVLPITMNDKPEQISLSLMKNPFQVTDEFCTKFQLLRNDCLTLQRNVLNLYAHSIANHVLGKCKSIFQLKNVNSYQLGDLTDVWKLQAYLWIPSTEWQHEVLQSNYATKNVNIMNPTSNSIFTINSENGHKILRNVIHLKLSYGIDGIPERDKTHGNDNETGKTPDHIRISLDNSPVYFHDHIVDVNLVNVQFSLLTIGTHELMVQLGTFDAGSKTVLWLLPVQVVFDVVPSHIYHPTRNAMIHDFNVPSMDTYPHSKSTNDGVSMNNIRRPLKIAYITDIGGLDGQSRVMISTALNLNKSQFHVTFLSTKETKPPQEILVKLLKQDIHYLNIPVKIKSNLFWNIFKGSMQPLLDIVSTIKSLDEVVDEDVRNAIGLMVSVLRGFDILTFTNIHARRIEDSIISHLARIAQVPIRICDPGKLNSL